MLTIRQIARANKLFNVWTSTVLRGRDPQKNRKTLDLVAANKKYQLSLGINDSWRKFHCSLKRLVKQSDYTDK